MAGSSGSAATVRESCGPLICGIQALPPKALEKTPRAPMEMYAIVPSCALDPRLSELPDWKYGGGDHPADIVQAPPSARALGNAAWASAAVTMIPRHSARSPVVPLG